MNSLYNRYISGAWPDASQNMPASSPAQQTSSADTIFADLSAAEQAPPKQPERSRNPSVLKGLFGGNFRLPEFDADTNLLLVLVYFLVADDTENISDTILIIGVLLLLGF